MENSYNGWTNWATWNTALHGDFETKDDINCFRDMIEEHKALLEENRYFHSMTYFDEINWEELYNSVEDEIGKEDN